MSQIKGQYILYKTPKSVDKELPVIQKITAKNNIIWKTTPAFTLPNNLGERQFIFSEKKIKRKKLVIFLIT